MIYRNVGALVTDRELVSLSPRATVQEAAELMATHRIGAIAVLESESLRGLFTERDLLNRVVAKGLQPESLRLEEVMTKDPIAVDTDTSLVASLKVMSQHKFRHLPVMENERVIGVISCRDIPVGYWMLWDNWVAAQNELKSASA